MKRTILITLTLILTASLALAMNHGSGHDKHGKSAPAKTGHHQSAPAKSEHGGAHHGKEMSDGMVMLGSETLDGVKAAAHINDVREAMAKAGMPMTHHFMVAFEEEATGTAIDTGRVAVRIVSPSGVTSPAIALPGMGDHFGVDVELSETGTYKFQVGSRLSDDKTRQFEFSYEVK